MLAHPETEWIRWIDSDASFTDMEFKIPFERYNDRNLVIHGWSHLIYEAKEKSWTSLKCWVILDPELPMVHEPQRDMASFRR